MTERFAIYFAPARDSGFGERGQAWLDQLHLRPLTQSARRYGFHATIKAPMALAAGKTRTQLETGLDGFGRQHAPVPLGRLGLKLIDGFLALAMQPQSAALANFAGNVVKAFETFRSPLTLDERARRLKAPLTSRQVELLDRYGYPYVLEQFQFHMTLTDRLPDAERATVVEAARDWFAADIEASHSLDRLVLFTQADATSPFVRQRDSLLTGTA